MKLENYISQKYISALDLKPSYINNEPFEHIVMKDFFHPEILNKVYDEFPDLSNIKSKIEFANQKEIKLASSGFADISPSATKLIAFLNSNIFLEYLNIMTGIDEILISDPYLSGGGYHEIKKGGVLKIHADFNKHPKMDLDRRLNLLIYLNKDWNKDWNGNLELYEENNLAEPVKSIVPEFNTCVIFTTRSNTFHGHPDKLSCPENVFRRSIALYYFSIGRPVTENSDKHSTLFVESKGEQFSKSGNLRNLAKDFFPPILFKVLKKIFK
jgi:Rps23 Pro-64 3,4-dihydroxylase Tpa1-like proline 4-hydroxylase